MTKSLKWVVATLSLMTVCTASAKAESTYSAFAAPPINKATYTGVTMEPIDNKDLPFPKNYKYLGIGGSNNVWRTLNMDWDKPAGIQLKINPPAPVIDRRDPPLFSLVILGGKNGSVPVKVPPVHFFFCFQNTVTKKPICEQKNWDNVKKWQIGFDGNWPSTWEVVVRTQDFDNPEIYNAKNVVFTKVIVVEGSDLFGRHLHFGLARINGEPITKIDLTPEGWPELDPQKCCN